MEKTFKPLTKAEEQIMQVLWKLGKGFTHDIIEELPMPKPHYNTVSTILKILQGKGYVSAETIGRAHCFYPLIAKNNYRKGSMQQFVKGYFSGSYKAMVSFFAKEDNISVKDLESILNEMKNQND